jgi:hypothetical protein
LLRFKSVVVPFRDTAAGWGVKTLNWHRPYISAKAAPSRAKRVGLVVGACALAALALTVGAGANSSIFKGSVTEAAAAAARDPMSVFAKRSPGHRGLGALFQTKAPAFVTTAIDRATGHKTPKPAIDAPEPASPAVEDEPVDAALIDAPEPFVENTAGLDLPIVEPFYTPPESISGGPGGPIIQNFGGDPTTGGPGGLIAELPESPVPEPQTWAIMILGFFGIGVALRIQARRARLGDARHPALADGAAR